MIRKLFAGGTLITMFGFLAVEVWAHVKANTKTSTDNSARVKVLEAKEQYRDKRIEEMSKDIKTILREMPRK